MPVKRFFKKASLLLILIMTPVIVAEKVLGRAYMQDFTTLFFSIFLEALPYILVGTIISSFIQVYVATETIKKVLPRQLLPGLLLGAAAGFVFPVCECGIIPVARGLIQKGVPLPVTVTFMLAAPVINPVALASTAAAFNDAGWAWARGIFAFFIAIWTGFLVSRLAGANQIKNGVEQCTGCCDHHHHTQGGGKLIEVLSHTADDFLNLSVYLIAGAFIASATQVLIPREQLLALGGSPLTSSAVMMALAYVLSLCSEADAFVAAAFSDSFTHGSIMAFLLLGPMLDLKNSFVLFSTFKARFVVRLSIILVLDIFILSLAITLAR